MECVRTEAGACLAALLSCCTREAVLSGGRAAKNTGVSCKPMTLATPPTLPETPPLVFCSTTGALVRQFLAQGYTDLPQAIQFSLTILFPQRETTDILAHGHKAVEILL